MHRKNKVFEDLKSVFQKTKKGDIQNPKSDDKSDA